MKLSTVEDWLDWIGSVHSQDIELGLDRIKVVADHLDVLVPDCPVVIVGGTNGKGSTVAGLEAIYRAAGYRTGAFTSPILFRHNEYVRINGVEASDADFCQAYKLIESARGDIALTPFEYHTLAALIMFKRYQPDVLLLEVGLGGRLDAVNIIDADVAVVTSIGIDHIEWLGSTREAIAREKAGIFRQGRFAVYGEPDIPDSILKEAEQNNVTLFCSGRDYGFQLAKENWTWVCQSQKMAHLPFNPLAIQNMATALMVIQLLRSRLPVSDSQIQMGLKVAALTGRIQVIEGPVTRVFDVSHNPAAISFLAEKLKQRPCLGKTRAVFSMLGDKDIAGSINAIQEQIDYWYVAPLETKRAASVLQLQQAVTGIKNIDFFASITQAYEEAIKQAVEGDRVVVFGSFYTVSLVLGALTSCNA